MLNLFELEQFVCFAENKTLTAVSELMNISQPTLTRSMQHVENEFGVKLFIREKNRLSLNETGEKAADYARQLLNMQENAIRSVREFDRKIRSITIESCAPKPLWMLASKTARDNPDNEIVSSLCPSDKIISDVLSGNADFGILPFKYEERGVKCIPYIGERLYICAVKGHGLYECDGVTFSQLNGYNCLLRDHIGFWADLCRERMPASKFLVQTDEDEFRELISTSSLLCFTTNLVSGYEDLLGGRKIIPITDECADVKYYIIKKKKER